LHELQARCFAIWIDRLIELSFQHRIQFDDTATRTFEYPSEASILEGEASSVDGETSSSMEQQSTPSNNKSSSTTGSTTSMPSLLGKIVLESHYLA
jgi:hypothetical protein